MVVDAMVGVVRLGDGWDVATYLYTPLQGIRCSERVLHNVIKVLKHESKV